MNKIIRIVVVVALVSAIACTKKEKSQNSASSSAQLPSAAAAKAVQKSIGDVPVKILPESPTVLTDLQLVFTCAQNVTYEWRKNNVIIPGENTGWLQKKQFVKGDEIAATVKCNGSEGTAFVTIGNSAPSISSVPLGPEDVHAGVDITVKPEGYDPDGDIVNYHYKWLVNGNPILSDSPVLSGAYIKRGDKVDLTVIPYDRDGEGTPFVSLEMVIPNGAPRILSSPPLDVKGGVYLYRVLADDPDGDPITFSLLSAPEGMTIDGHTGEIRWPITEKSSGDHIIEVAAQDPGGVRTTQKYTLTISFSGGGQQ